MKLYLWYSVATLLLLCSLTSATIHDDAQLPRSRDFDRMVTRLRQRRTPCLPSDRAAELDQRLLAVTSRMRDGYSSGMLSQIRGLIRSGASATTSVFNDYELCAHGNIADVVSDRFLAQLGTDQKPDQDLFKSISLLIMAGPAAVTNRRYVGNGGQTSAELIEMFLSTGLNPMLLPAPHSGQENVRILYRQATRLLQFIYAQQMIHGLSRSESSNTCRLCLRIQLCASGRRPLDDSFSDLVMSFIEADLIHQHITGTAPISHCPHDRLSRDLPYLDEKIFLGIFELGDLRDSIIPLILHDRESASTFFNGMHRSAASRRLLRSLLRNKHVPALLLQTEWFMCELVRRKDCKTLRILAPAVPRDYDKTLLASEFRQLVHCADGVKKILVHAGLI